MDPATERLALDAAVRAGVVPAALAQHALAHQAALARAGTAVSALALVAERLTPAGRAALQRLLQRPGETTPGSAPAGAVVRPAALPAPGERVGAYVIERELGRGGMGAVFVATHVELDRQVALKLLLAAADPRLAERFTREAQAVARLQHPGIVGLHEVGVDALGRRFLAMHLVEGESLLARLQRQGPLPDREAARLALEVARALEHAHSQGLLHRDLKPHNVLVDRDGRARLTDFGLVRDAQDARMTNTGELLGTPAYMAPEQAAGERGRVEARTDVYGLGATLYHALTGRPPFEGPALVNVITSVLTRPPRPPSELRPDVAPALEAICLRCLEKAPEARYPTCAALADDLERFLGGEAVAAPARRPRSRRAALGAAAVGTFALLAAGWWLTGTQATTTGPADVALPTPAEVTTRVPAVPEPAPVDPRGVRVVDADTWRDREELELRSGWLVRPTERGLELRAGTGLRMTGFYLALKYAGGEPFEVEADVEVAYLDPSLPLALVCKTSNDYAISAALVGRWRREARANVLEHLLTVFARKKGTPSQGLPPEHEVVAHARAFPAGPITLRLRLRYEPSPTPTLQAWSVDGTLPRMELPLPAPPPAGECYVGLLLEDPGDDVHVPHDQRNVFDASRVLVTRFAVVAEPGVMKPLAPATPHSEHGRFCRRLLAGRESLQDTLLPLLVDPDWRRSASNYLAQVTLHAGLLCAERPALAPHTDQYLAFGLGDGLDGEAAQDGWRLVHGSLAALTAPQRRALFRWALRREGLDEADALGTGLGLIEQDEERGRPDARRWTRAALLLEGGGGAETHPLETGQALCVLGDFERALELFLRVRDADPARRAEATRHAGWAAFRLRRFDEAARLWQEAPPLLERRQRIAAGLARYPRE